MFMFKRYYNKVVRALRPATPAPHIREAALAGLRDAAVIMLNMQTKVKA